MKKENIITLDVRPILASGTDPFMTIMSALDKLPAGHTLEIVNSFEPIPLLNKLKKEGYDYETDRSDISVVHTFIEKVENQPVEGIKPTYTRESMSFEECESKFKGCMVELDVRHLEMPMPMVTILESLETLKEGEALFVHHQRLPQFLLPELEDRHYIWASKVVDESNTKLIIFK